MNDTGEVKLHFLDYWRVIKVRWAILTISFFLVVTTAAVTCYFLPREYFSKVTLEVKPDDAGLKIASGDNNNMRGTRDATLAPTQFQILRQKEILYPVIENLGLAKAWGGGQELPKEQVYYQLLRKMKIQEVRGTELLEVGVYSTDKEEAANIANTIAVVYQEQRRSSKAALLKQGLGQLEEAVAKKRKDVEEAQAEVQEIRQREGIIDLNPEILESVETTETRTLTTDEAQVNEAKTKITELKAQLEQTEKLKPEALMTALHMLNIDDPTVAKILPLYQDASAEEARMLNSGLGENHPRVKALRAQKDVYAQQLGEQMSALRNSLAIKLRVNEATLDRLNQKLAESRADYQKTRTQNVEYIKAKNKYILAKRLLEATDQRLETEMMQAGLSTYPVAIHDKAEPSMYPAKPNVIAYMSLSVVAGLVLGISLAFFLEYLDTSIKTLDDVERLLALPVLAVIPKGVTSLLKAPGGDSPDAEAYRILQTNMEFNRKNPNATTFTLISGGPGEGKSTTLNNLAYTCAKGGYNVLVVDADLRRPSQHTFFGVDNAVGLSDCLTGDKEMEEVVQSTALPNLSFIPSGRLPHDAVGILNSHRLTELVAKAKAKYDLVFFDSPPILGVSDASILASEVDLTIMVIQYRRFPRAMVQRVKHAVLHVGGTVLGAVLNNVDTRHDAEYQYYTQYYDYYTPRPAEKGAKNGKPLPGRERSTQTHGDY